MHLTLYSAPLWPSTAILVRLFVLLSGLLALGLAPLLLLPAPAAKEAGRVVEMNADENWREMRNTVFGEARAHDEQER
jgi:hypothetical protein